MQNLSSWKRHLGIEVSEVWPQLFQKNRLCLIDEIVRIEKAALECPPPSYDSTFFRYDAGFAR
jgi:hypothetical protein